MTSKKKKQQEKSKKPNKPNKTQEIKEEEKKGTVKDRIARDKERVLKALESSLGIVTSAIAKVGISNYTFYDWFKKDEEFKKRVEEIQDVFSIVVEDKLKTGILQDDQQSIRFYLSHRVDKYKPKVEFGAGAGEGFNIKISTKVTKKK